MMVFALILALLAQPTAKPELVLHLARGDDGRPVVSLGVLFPDGRMRGRHVLSTGPCDWTAAQDIAPAEGSYSVLDLTGAERDPQKFGVRGAVIYSAAATKMGMDALVEQHSCVREELTSFAISRGR